jgi:plastocyanin
MRRIVTSSIAVLIALVAVTAASAAVTGVTIRNFSFTPAAASAARGGTVTWTNDGPSTHTTTQDAGLWNSGQLSRGSSFNTVLFAAGSYPYHCTIHSSMKGTVKIPAAVTPSTGGVQTVFTVTVASKTAPPGFEYNVQMKPPGGAFAAWRTITTAKTTFTASSTGVYSFRSRLHRVGSSAASGYSAARSITVS